jgi:5'-nucleotidase / UDP-sugar diphosphatase
MITQAGSGLKYAGKITLTVENGHVTGRHEEIISLDSISHVNAKVQVLINHYNDNEEFRKVVGVADAPVSGFDELGSLITDALVHQLKVDFAFVNRRGIRISALPKGDITLKNIYQLDPFQNDMITFRLSGNEITSLIRYSYDLKNLTDLAVSGMTYTVLTDSSGQCKSVVMKDSAGKVIDPSLYYTVALNSYVASAYRFDHRDKGYSNGITSEEVLVNYLIIKKKVNYTGVRRTFVKAGSKESSH